MGRCVHARTCGCTHTRRARERAHAREGTLRCAHALVAHTHAHTHTHTHTHTRAHTGGGEPRRRRRGALSIRSLADVGGHARAQDGAGAADSAYTRAHTRSQAGEDTRGRGRARERGGGGGEGSGGRRAELDALLAEAEAGAAAAARARGGRGAKRCVVLSHARAHTLTHTYMHGTLTHPHTPAGACTH